MKNTDGTTTINTQGDNDRVEIQSTDGDVNVNGGDEDDQILVGFVITGDLLPTTDHLAGVLTITGGAGADTLTFDDRGQTASLVISIDQNAVTGLTDNPVGYSAIETLNLFIGSGDDVLNVRGTTAVTNVELNDGDEHIFVSSAANATLANAATIDFLIGHLDLLVGAELNLNAGHGRHQLMISDEATTTGDNNVTITDSGATGMEIIISGLAVSDISYGATATGNFAEGITIWSGFGNDTIDIDATHFRAGTDGAGNTIRTITTLNTGLGDDDITVTLLHGSDGFFVLNSQGPHNDQPLASDQDTIDASASTLGLIIFGGQDDDDITGGQARDYIFGDRGVVMFFDPLPADIAVGPAIEPMAVIVVGNGGPGDRTNGVAVAQSVGFGTHITVGGNDTIHGGDGDDYLMGQTGNDTIYGEGGEDDIIGGNNVVGGLDGDDMLFGGAAADVIIGDNGSITRFLIAANGEWQRYLAPFDDVIRVVQLFDLADGIGGDDTIEGGDGDDLLYGQIGNDTLDGGNGDDELTGGLGNNSLIGGNENDILVGGVAQIIRAYNADGTIQLNSNGSWHRDVVFELVGTVIGYVDIDDTPEEFELLALAEQLLAADMWLIVGTFDADGNRVDSGPRTGWRTRILLIDLDAPGDEMIDGGAGDDVIVGGYGNDILLGGSGNDLIIGDVGTNLSPYSSDLPLMLTGIRLRDDATGTLALEQFGTFVVPDVALETAFVNTTTPHLTVVPETAPHLFNIATGDFILGSDGAMLVPYVSMVPDVRNNVDSQPGNDTIDGGEGDDTIIGDNLTIYSQLLATHTVIQALMNTLVTQLANLQVSVYHMASMYDIGNTHINGVAGNNAFTIGSDTISGGAGNDNIVGDNSFWVGTSRYGVPNLTSGDDIVEQTVTFHRHLMDLSHVVSDADHAVSWANQQAHKALRRNRLLGRNVDLDRNQLWMHNDVINGDGGNDVIAGDDSIVNMPIVTSLVSFKSQTKALKAAIGRRAVKMINREVRQQSARMSAKFNIHTVRDRKALLATAPIDRDAGRLTFDLFRANDNIDSGDGDDTVAGDTLIVGQPAFNISPVSRPERARLRGQMRRIMNRTRTTGVDYVGTVNYTLALKIPRRGSMEVVVANDTIQGGAGNDVLVGDNADMSPYSFPRTEFVPGRYEVRSLKKLGRTFTNTHRGGNDTIDGGAGDDKIDGRGGFDHLTGGLGVDNIYGGSQRDTIVRDGSDVIVRNGGRLARTTLVDMSNSWMDQVTDSIASAWNEVDAKSRLWIRVRLRR